MRRTVADHQKAVADLLGGAWKVLPGNGGRDVGSPVPLLEARGRVLATDLVAPIDLPPFANSQMDGYAIHMDALQPKSVDSNQSTSYAVVETIAAGSVPERLAEGSAAPIMTGAMLPRGANTVVPIEKALPDTFAAAGETVELPATLAGTFVREQGSDVQLGETVIAAGTLLNAAHLGLAAALGCTQLTVARKVRVLLLTTGDEVLAPGDPLAANGLPPGMIFDANAALLRAALAESGLEVIQADVVNDDPAALLRLLEENVGGVGGGPDDAAQPGCQLIISVGGISAGAFEVVKLALANAGPQSDMAFCSVALQPGGPQGLGTFRGVPFLAFPGNPVSAFVSLEMFLRPALSTLLGTPAPRQRVVAVLEHPMTSPAGKHQVRRGIYSGPAFESAPSVREVGGQSSHLLGALAKANALINVPAGVTELQAGAKVEVWLL
ncbi:gephyrin-like molybdotransferase Glp [Arthrobacter sp. H35-D1]|uniref:molybdopterin molybdotransferase MoeA n=1 Tax=Arthrobacter sp. H35-D1 TaxID=3046202 RepID=UPI0024B9CA3A|nr:gephyrin-like molybdotransferase Glp [Arthrobacter sp. H35-D1]MDJ0313714.1 molybdopterin molybdotransferase MoeA [Arthrobacter sp. H35-D1]